VTYLWIYEACVFVFIPSAQADERTEMYCRVSESTVKTLTAREQRITGSPLHTKRQTGTQKHGRNAIIDNSDFFVVKQPWSAVLRENCSNLQKTPSNNEKINFLWVSSLL